MDDFMKAEAKDTISTAIEKASGATGINVEVRIISSIFHVFLFLFDIVCMQVRERPDGPSIRALLALCHGRGILVRSNAPGEDNFIYVLCRKNSNFTFQVLNIYLNNGASLFITLNLYYIN